MTPPRLVHTVITRTLGLCKSAPSRWGDSGQNKLGVGALSDLGMTCLFHGSWKAESWRVRDEGSAGLPCGFPQPTVSVDQCPPATQGEREAGEVS
jgi:hypothetical protein